MHTTRDLVAATDASGDHGGAEEGERLAGELAFRLIALAVHARPELRRAARGGVAGEIAAAAAAHDADLVVLGSRGRADLGGLLPGSVAREVLERVSCPVLLVRAGRRGTGRRRRVLLALTGDEDPSDVVRTTAAVADHDAQVLVLHLLATDDAGQQLGMSELLVERMVAGLRRCGVRARGPVLAGQVARTAVGYGADLIVTGSRRLPAVAALLRVT